MRLRAAAALALALAVAPLAAGADSFPARLGGAFTLTDQDGNRRSQRDPQGRAQLLFFGYANCAQICSVALPLMGQVADLARAAGMRVVPVMVTVDPERDRVGTIGPALKRLHPDFVGLTGTEAELAAVYRLFGVERKLVFTDPLAGAVYAHGSFVYLLDARGTVQAVLPPILSAERMVEIMAAHMR
ncbi:MAG: SCO family protein [Alphaproteobacteria bacterium]|nr:MAG: SCO family protein [Alphaproteobacteria bacterium]